MLSTVLSIVAILMAFFIVWKIDDMFRSSPSKSANDDNPARACDPRNDSGCKVPKGCQGCTWDWDCKGWSFFGEVACCNNVCVTKGDTIQSCDGYCSENPVECTKDGTSPPPGNYICPGW